MNRIVVSNLGRRAAEVEVVERKGLGHPDTICDALAETFSRNLCREYRDRFGEILHHNVDKALLIGGRAKPAFGGGAVIAPMEVLLAGRAVRDVNGIRVPVEETAVEGSREWLQKTFHALDPERHVQIASKVRAGSTDLQALFGRRANVVPLANDTSIGVGFAPLSALERLVLDIDAAINTACHHKDHLAWGEDIKIMAVRHGRSVDLTIACAMIGRHLRNENDYRAQKNVLEALGATMAGTAGFDTCAIRVNAADVPEKGELYLTVTGTSAEAGDDGEVGRGNRANGLITPLRPMSLEAAAGKNPVSHVGKIYNVVARDIAETLVAGFSQIREAQCLLVSRIGAPISQPSLINVSLSTHDGSPAQVLAKDIDGIVANSLAELPTLLDRFIAGGISVF